MKWGKMEEWLVEKEWQEKVYDREEWKKLLRTARNRCILHMPVEWMNEWMHSWGIDTVLLTKPWGESIYFVFFFSSSLDSSVGIVTLYRLVSPGNESSWRWDFPHHSDWSRCSPSHQWVLGLWQGLSGWGMALTTHPYLAPRLKKE
jgi:hypothetical protein